MSNDTFKEKTFTKDDALNIQSEHLAEWRERLIDDCYADLERWTKETNDEVTDPYQIRRGNQLTTFISNWKPLKEGTKIRAKEILSGEYYEGTYLFRRGTHLMKCQMVEGHEEFDFYQIYYDTIEHINHEPKARLVKSNK